MATADQRLACASGTPQDVLEVPLFVLALFACRSEAPSCPTPRAAEGDEVVAAEVARDGSSGALRVPWSVNDLPNLIGEDLVFEAGSPGDPSVWDYATCGAAGEEVGVPLPDARISAPWLGVADSVDARLVLDGEGTGAVLVGTFEVETLDPGLEAGLQSEVLGDLDTVRLHFGGRGSFEVSSSDGQTDARSSIATCDVMDGCLVVWL